MAYQKIDLSTSETLELVNLFQTPNTFENSDIPVISKIVKHIQTQLQLPLSKSIVSGKIYKRDEGGVYKLSGEGVVGKAVVNINCREIYGTSENGLRPERQYLLENGDYIIIPGEYCQRLNVVVGKNPIQKMKTGGREVAVLRPKSYERITLVVNLINQ